jgi:clan AA aspartic protease (TIGR02281 family)
MRRPDHRKPLRRFLWAGAFLLLLAAGCAVTFHREVLLHEVRDARRPPGLNFINYDEALDDGYDLEVEQFLTRQPAEYQSHAAVQMALCRIALYRGELDRARVHGEAALKALPHTVPTYGKLCWTMALLHYFMNDFPTAHRYAEDASNWGYHTDGGFRTFLRDCPAALYEYSQDAVRTPFTYADVRIPQVPVVLSNGKNVQAIVDTGASLTFLSESMARELGIPLSKDRKSSGYGLHGRLIPIHLVYLDSLTIGGMTVRHIPAMVFTDSDLSFGAFRVDVGLGFHLLRQGRLQMDYRNRILDWNRKAAPARSGEPNLCIMGLRPAVRVSINQIMGYQFILDTGSEQTFVTTQGSRRAILQEKLNLFSMVVRGIGKSKINYTNVSNVFVGTDRYMVKFTNVPTKQEYANLVDGILGNDFLDNFLVTADFPAGRLTLETPH